MGEGKSYTKHVTECKESDGHLPARRLPIRCVPDDEGADWWSLGRLPPGYKCSGKILTYLSNVCRLKAHVPQWLHYLLQKLIYYKGLKPPSVPRKTKAASTETYRPPSTEASFSEMDCYECLMDLEQWLGKHIAMIPAANLTPAMKGKGKRKIQGPVKPHAYSGPARAGEIVAYGVKKEWIKSTRLC